MKILYAGFDGLSFDVFTNDNLKNFKAFREKANWGYAYTKIAHTFPSWTTINTGREDHGLTNDSKGDDLTVHNKYKYIWDYLHERGYSCGVLSFPVTYPPRNWKNGWFVSGYPHKGHCLNWLKFPNEWYSDWVDYVAEVWLQGEYKASGLPVDTSEKLVKELCTFYGNSILGFLDNAPEVEFLAVQVAILDRAFHEIFNKPFIKDRTEPLPKLWEYTDYLFGKLIDYQKPDIILLASDHGVSTEEHTNDGVWGISGLDVKQNHRIDIDNVDLLDTFLDIMWIRTTYRSHSRLIREIDLTLLDRLKSLGYQ